ncbi:unannotated protein [freshwater metagenome]|uniref:Unannotated protein n=1 Tax=freshwater metagenome TaxID=449393 RepID=A0A6J6UTZ2_9ZZZZ
MQCLTRVATGWRASTILVVVAGVLASMLAAQPAAAVGRPGNLSTKAEPTAVVLSWRPVRGADSYHVQISTTDSFNSVLWSGESLSTMATPTRLLAPGTMHWRVAAEQDGRVGTWSVGKFTLPRSKSPVLVAPADGAQLAQPDEAVLLEWESLPGAQAYQVEVDDANGDWIDFKTAVTSLTSYAPINATPGGTYWWRVRGILGEGNLTPPSEARSFVVGELPKVTLKRTEPLLEDVVLEWDAKPGAVRYEIRVSTDDDFNVITDQRYVAGTRYSPPVTYDNANYWWQVRAVNVDGRAEEWPSESERIGVFRRHWPETPSLVWPQDGSAMTGDPFLEWTPVPKASGYEIQVGSEPSFSSSATFRSCSTNQTTFTLKAFRGTRISPGGCEPFNGTNYWRVRALDNHGSATARVNGVFSSIGSFTYSAPSNTAGTTTPALVTGQRVLLAGTRTSSCIGAVGAEPCTEIPATPVFDWDPVPGATYYQFYLAHDVKLTNMVDNYGDLGNPDSLVSTTSTRFMPSGSLPDTQAGEAYYWYVRACAPGAKPSPCSLTPTSASHAFQKKSAPVRLTTPADGATVADWVTFGWEDYLATNLAWTAGAVGAPGQAALQYHVQVATSPSFTSGTIVDDRRVDQTTYTAFDRTYPEGTLYWRVQAVDGSDNELTWSSVRSFTKQSPAPELRSPEDAVTVSGLRGLRWKPLIGAKYYDVEIYRNADTAASPSNRVAWAQNIRQALFTPPRPLCRRPRETARRRPRSCPLAVMRTAH